MFRGTFTRDGSKPFHLIGTKDELLRFAAMGGVKVHPNPYNPEWLK